MRAILATTIYPPDIGGPATYAWEVSRRLRQRRHRVAVVTPSLNARPSEGLYLPPRGFTAAPLVGAGVMHASVLVNLLRAGAQGEVFLVQNPLFLGLLTIIAGRALGRRVVLRFPGDKAWEYAHGSGQTNKTLHDFLAAPEGDDSIHRILRLQRFVLQHADRVIAPSHYVKGVLTTHYGLPPDRVSVIYQSVDLADFRAPGGVQVAEFSRPIILSVGRLVRHKRVDGLVKALAAIVNRYPGANLLIAGEGPEEARLRAQASNLGLADHVHFLGAIPRHQVIGLLRKADVFVLNSLWEGQPHVAIEAMAAGAPLIATRILGMDEVVEDGASGLLVGLEPESALTDAMLRLLGDEGLRKRLAENARTRVRQLFSWDTNLPLLEQELAATAGIPMRTKAAPAEAQP